MPKNLVIVYTSGSCGDLVSIPWVATGQFYSVLSHHNITESGKASASYNNNFIVDFPKQPYLHHYSRDWTNDLDKLESLSTPFLIITAAPAQATIIKNHFGDRVHVISINYNKDNWSFVANGFCDKVLNVPGYLTKDDVGENFLNAVAKDSSQREQFLYLGQKGLLGQWYARHLAAGNIGYPPKENTFSGDTNLLLDEILDYSQLETKLENIAVEVGVELDLDSFSKIYAVWRSRQFQPTEINKILSNQLL